MDEQFWHQKWHSNEIGFHEGLPNALLVANFPALSLAPGARIFLPLCGKTRDIHWLHAQGFRVVGAELSQLAVEQLFAELGMRPRVSTVGSLQCHEADGISIFVGNIFDLNRTMLGQVDAIYDRAALVALPDVTRTRYAAHIAAITGSAPQLLICFDYDQSAIAGPPFSVPAKEVHRLYDHHYHLTALEARDVEGGLKGVCPARETVWLLMPKDSE